ncbi:hypothetical protein PPYR_09697 [Photinus pyralis]|uniref:Gustatory receptor n=3 Tax=Photinus pyralis TaxID=7054 RepID=A0A5N4AN21_PHOPY|nr:hypothetical protein PPYR_09697 [Photinus pyralis]
MYTSNFGDSGVNGQVQKRGVYLEGSNFYEPVRVTKVGATHPNHTAALAFALQKNRNGVLYEFLKPMMYQMRAMAVLPVGPDENNHFTVRLLSMIYCVIFYLLILAYVGYIKWDRVEINKSAEGKFEEAVIDYLFTVYLFPVVLVPISWYESRKIANVFNEWSKFEAIYKKLKDKDLDIFIGNKPLIVTLALPVIACGTMVINHMTMAQFRTLQVIPYCYINIITCVLGGIWYLMCDGIARVATLIAQDLEVSLRHVGPSQLVAEYRAMWMLLSKIVRDVGMAFTFEIIFLALYLFFIITLTIYGLFSQIQSGFGIKDVGLTITASLATMVLYYICDEAHYASYCVKVLFQKKLLLVELSWMNEDAQQEIQMFLRATEMSETSMSLGGFFDVNRTLFKSLLATMVTYLVVLLQFQISLPEDLDTGHILSTMASLLSTVK